MRIQFNVLKILDVWMCTLVLRAAHDWLIDLLMAIRLVCQIQLVGLCRQDTAGSHPLPQCMLLRQRRRAA
jgi:hypothetical protein